MQRFFMHGTVFNRVHRPLFRTAIRLQPTFQQVNNGRLTAAYRPHQQQDAFAYLQALSGRVEVLHDLLESLLNAKDLLREEVIAWLPRPGGLDPGIHDHMINALVRKPAHMRFLGSNLKVLGKSSFPL